MIEIILTQGQIAIIDDCDAYLCQYKWYAQWNKDTQSYYAVRSEKIDGKRIATLMARQILGLLPGDKRQSDHINHNTLDNTRENIRIVTNQENNFNRKHPKGYHLDKRSQKYLARIRVNGKLKYLGLYKTRKEAHQAYLHAKKKYHQIKERTI